MRFRRPVLTFALDEGVPNDVGGVLKDGGHKVIFLNAAIARGSKDLFVCAYAQQIGAILVAFDGDMRQIARGHGVSNERFKKLSLIKLSCREPNAAERVKLALTFIEHEWFYSGFTENRRVFIEIGDSLMKTNR